MATFDFDTGTVNSGAPAQATPAVSASPAPSGSPQFDFDTGSVNYAPTAAPTVTPVAPAAPAITPGVTPGASSSNPIATSGPNENLALPQIAPQTQNAVDTIVKSSPHTSFLGNLFSSVFPHKTPEQIQQKQDRKAQSDATKKQIVDQTLKDLNTPAPFVSKIKDDISKNPAYLNPFAATPAEDLPEEKELQKQQGLITDTRPYDEKHPLYRADNILGSSIVKGFTGGQASPQMVAPKNFTEKSLAGIGNAIGGISAIDAIGSKLGAIKTPAALTDFISQYPKVAQYALPMVEKFLSDVPGYVAYGQLNPDLKTFTDRLKSAVTSIGYAGVGASLAPLPKFASVPLNGAAFFGLAKLSGASNEDAASQGVIGMFFDALSPQIKGAGSEVGFTKDTEVNNLLHETAIDNINKFSDTKISKDSTDSEIKKAYREAISKVHPDVGGNQEDAASVNNSYDLLTGKSSDVKPLSSSQESAPEETKAPTASDISDLAEQFKAQAAQTPVAEEPVQPESPAAEPAAPEQVTVFHGEKGQGVSQHDYEPGRTLTVAGDQQDLIRQLAASGNKDAQALVDKYGNQKIDYNLSDPIIQEAYKDNYDSIRYNNEKVPIKGFEYHDLRNGTFYSEHEAVARAYSMQSRGAKFSTEENSPVAEAAKTLPEGKSEPESDSKIETQAGFVNPGEVVDSLKKAVSGTANYIEQTNKNVEFANNTDDTLYKAQKNAEADFILSDQLLAKTKDIPKDQIAKIDEYRDALGAGLEVPKLSEAEQQVNDNIINPIVKDTAAKRAFIKGLGVALPSEDTNHRIVKNKGGTLDKLVEQKNKYFPKGGIKGTKSVLTKSASSLKSRTMFNATDENGKRIVVSIKGGDVTAFENGKPTDLGKIKTKSHEELMKEDVTPIQKKIARTQKLIDTLESVKSRDPISSKKLSNLQSRIEALKGFSKEREVQNTAKGAIHETIQKEIEKTNQKISTLETRLKALKPFGNVPKVANAIDKLQSDIDAEYDHETNLSLSDIYENLSDFVGSNEAIDAKVAKELAKTINEFKILSKIPKGGDVILTAQRIENAQEKMRELVNELSDIEAKYDPNKLTDRVFVDKNGKQYTIGEATKNEIEAHTNVQYYHNPVVSAILENQDITRVYRAVQILDALKNSPEFQDRSFKSGEGLPPEGWKTANLDQFRGYYFEPHTANVLNAFAQDIKSGEDPVSALTAVNNFLTATMFLSPVKHLLNVGTSAAINRGVTGWLNPLAYPVLARTTIESIRSIVKQDDDYIKLLRAGAPVMSAKVDRAAYRDNVLANLGEKVDPYAKIARTALKIGGAITPWNWAHALTWPGNDIIIQQQIREELAKVGLTVKSATIPQIEKVINDVTKVLPSYRTPVALRNVPKYVTKNTLLFASYRYNLVKSFFELANTLVTGHVSGEPINFTEDSDGSRSRSYFSANEWKARGKAFNKILMMAFLAAIVVPYIDKKLKQLTHNNNAYISNPGQLSIIDNVNKLLSGQINIGQYIQTMIDLPPGTKELLQQITNLDFFTGQSIISKGGSAAQSAKERLAHFLTNITPYDLEQKIAGGKMTVAQLLEAQFGINEPKGNALVNILQGSSANVLEEVARLNKTATPPSSMNIENRPDVLVFKSQVTPEKYKEAISQFTGMFVSNTAKLMDNQYIKTTSKTYQPLDYKNATDAQKAKMIDTVKDETIKQIESAYSFDKGTGTKGKAVFEGQATKGGIPTIENLSQPHDDDGSIKGKNPNGEPIYERMPLSVSEPIRNELYKEDSYWKDNGYTPDDLALDHIVPVSAGGTNSKNNLELINNVSNQLNHPFELFMVQKYKDGTISRADVIRASVDYKINKSVSLTDIENGTY